MGDTVADDRGVFALPAPDPPFTVHAAKAGFAPARRTVSESPDEPLQVRLSPGAVITGQVLDESAQPLASVLVRLARIPDQSELQGPAQYVDETDDIGQFRIGSLPAGRYSVWLDGAAFEQQTDTITGVVKQSLSVRAPADASALREVVAVADGGEASLVLTYEPGAGLVDTVAQQAREFESAARWLTGKTAGATGVIRGRVSGPGGRPLAGALVRLMPQSPPGRAPRGLPAFFAASTDAQGAFEFVNLPEADYVLRVTRAGFPSIEYGQRRAQQEGDTLRLRADGRIENIDVTLSRGGVISGAILDENGEPLEGVIVRVWERVFREDRYMVQPVSSVRLQRTDDRGYYRIHGLFPGRYYVVAETEMSVFDRAMVDRLPIYYPGRASIAEAALVHVESDVIAAGLDFTADRITGARLAGAAMTSTGVPVSGPIFLMTSARSGAPEMAPRVTQPDAGGRFEFRNVAPGDYVIQAMTGDRTSRAGPYREFGTRLMTVTGVDQTDLSIVTEPGAVVSGRIRLDAASGSITPSDVRVQFQRADHDRAPAVSMVAPVRDDWTFRIENVFGPNRAVVTAPAGWWVKGVFFGGINAIEQPIAFGAGQSYTSVEVVLSPRAATLTGRALNAQGEGITDASVILFSSRFPHWFSQSPFVKLARAGGAGRFTIASVPPGEYYVVAIDGIDGNDWRNPDVLSVLVSGALRIELEEDQVRDVDLQLQRVPSY